MKDLFGAVADIHLTLSNIDEVSESFCEAVDLCVARDCKVLFLLGDIFTNRKSLEFEVLQAFSNLLDYCHRKGILVIKFPGNHDKISYQSERSYLDIFQHHPGVKLITDLEKVEIEGHEIYVLPFFEERTALNKYLEKLRKLKTKEGGILLTHIAIDGVKNNDGSVIDGVVNRKLFKLFDTVLVGHYHNKQVVDNITYIGSLRQNNHGEDDKKGITFMKENGELEQCRVAFKKFLTVDIDLEEVDTKEIQTLTEIYSDSGENIRFKFKGSQDQLKKVNRSELTAVGIDVAYKESVVEEIEEESVIEFSGFNKNKIIGEWGDFCDKKDERDLYRVQGAELLEKI